MLYVQWFQKRIAKQYQQYCKETGFQPFTRSTVLRILSSCSATVCKSLQGLDYIAAEGAKAFEDLMGVVKKVGEVRQDSALARQLIDGLKNAKQYLKGDFKVCYIILV